MLLAPCKLELPVPVNFGVYLQYESWSFSLRNDVLSVSRTRSRRILVRGCGGQGVDANSMCELLQVVASRRQRLQALTSICKQCTVARLLTRQAKGKLHMRCIRMPASPATEPARNHLWVHCSCTGLLLLSAHKAFGTRAHLQQQLCCCPDVCTARSTQMFRASSGVGRRTTVNQNT